jgi:hypothetical protein
MTVPKIVMESVHHLYDCTKDCNGTLHYNLMYSHKDDAQSPLKSNVQS